MQTLTDNQHCISSRAALLLTPNRGRSDMRLCCLEVDLYISSSSCCWRSIWLDIERSYQDCWIARLLYPPLPCLRVGRVGKEKFWVKYDSKSSCVQDHVQRCWLTTWNAKLHMKNIWASLLLFCLLCWRTWTRNITAWDKLISSCQTFPNTFRSLW